MKAVLRGIVSMAFSTIEDQKTQRRVSPKAKNVPTISRTIITPPSPVPADEVYKPLSSTDPIPFGAITKVESFVNTLGAPNLESSLPSTSEKEDVASIEIKPEDLIPDNLSQIKGLDPIAIMGLNKRGIVTFLQIANLTDQESTGISASYTMGGMTLAGAMNEVDSMDGVATGDYEGYEFNLSFAF